MEFDAGDAAGIVAGGFARRLFCVVLAMLLNTSSGEVGEKGEAVKVVQRADRQKEERRWKGRQNSRLCYCVRREADWLRYSYSYLVIAKEIPSLAFLTLPARTSDTCTCVFPTRTPYSKYFNPVGFDVSRPLLYFPTCRLNPSLVGIIDVAANLLFLLNIDRQNCRLIPAEFG